MKKIYTKFALCVFALWGLTSCEDFLEVKSDSQKQVGNSFKNIDDLRGATAFLYTKPWNKFNEHTRGMTSGRANDAYIDGVTGNMAALALFAENSNFNELFQTWGSLYVAITQADYIIKDYVPIAIANGVNETQAKACEGEARFMRATAYWYLAMLWHDVPIVDDPRDFALNTLIPPHHFEDVIQYAIHDLSKAADVLPATDVKGRVTKYSAKGMLARVCLTAANYARGNRFSPEYLARNNAGSNAALAQTYYDQVKVLTESVITESSYGLMDDYEELFRTQTNNNKEVLFGIQFLPGVVEYGLGNPLNGALSYDLSMTENIGGSSALFISYDLLKWLVDDKALSRLRGNVCIPGQKYSYIGTHLPAGSWTVPSGRTKCNIKKFVVGGIKDTDGIAVQGNSGHVPALMRLAEVYLMYTEAAIGMGTQTSDGKALEYANAIRKRAFKLNPADFVPYTSISLNDLLKERRMEFFHEIVFWPDLVRRSFYDMDWVLNFLNNKLKDTNPTTEFTNWASFSYTFDPLLYPNTSGWNNSPRQQAGYIPQKVEHNVAQGSYVHAPGAKSNIWTLPYPAAEVSSNPKLLTQPVRYNF